MTAYPVLYRVLYYRAARGYYRTDKGQAWLVVLEFGERRGIHIVSEQTKNALLAGYGLPVAA